MSFEVFPQNYNLRFIQDYIKRKGLRLVIHQFLIMIDCLGRDLASQKSDRAAVIPYYFYNAEVYFGFAIDDKTGDITDFGGGVKKYEYALAAGIREFFEESKGVFRDCYSVNKYEFCFGLYTSKQSTIFYPIHNEIAKNIPIRFRNKIMNGDKHNEVSDVVWLSLDEFRNYSRNISSYKSSRSPRVMWGKLRKFYRRINFEKLKETLRIKYKYQL